MNNELNDAIKLCLVLLFAAIVGGGLAWLGVIIAHAI
jgi:hypothetical protein